MPSFGKTTIASCPASSDNYFLAELASFTSNFHSLETPSSASALQVGTVFAAFKHPLHCRNIKEPVLYRRDTAAIVY